MAKRRQPAALRRYWATHKRKGRKHSPKRRKSHRKHYRKNWISPGAIVAANPHRRRIRAHRVHHRKKRRHTYRHNPTLLGMHIPAVRTVAFVGVGFVGPSMVSGFLTSMFPTVMQ